MRPSWPLACLLLCARLVAADPWSGDLQVAIPGDSLRAGTTVRLTLSAEEKGKAKPGVIAERAARFSLLPYRWNLFEPPARILAAERAAPDAFSVQLPADLPSGHYLLVAAVADDDGRMPGSGERFMHRRVVAVRGADAGGPFLRVHAERGRCVFSPGERLRLFVSARGSAAITGEATVAWQGAAGSLRLAAGKLDAAAGTEQVLAFDIEPQVSSAIPPGDGELVASLGGKVLDRVRVRMVTAERPAGGGRWGHTFPHGNGSGFERGAVLPETLAGAGYGDHAERTLAPIHAANLWVNFFANAWPIIGPAQDLPEAAAADLPPVAGAYRPSLTHAFYQKLMAEGIALGIFMGYGEDYKAETYMPLPTIDRGQQAILARKYLAGSLAAATLPSFVAAYTDAYGHMDWAGGGEMTAGELAGVREATWRAAAKAAGITVADKPLAISFDEDDWTKEARDVLRKRDAKARQAFEQVWKAKQEAAGGGKGWLAEACPTEAEQLALWNACFAAAGVTPAPAPARREPLPQLDPVATAAAGRDAAYRYASFVLRGIERCYGAITRLVEGELPAVFTIHNKGTMNHSSAPHAWTGWRTPNIDAAYMVDGASAVSVSEWNLDAVPKPYFMPTFHVQNLVDRGIPVYQCGLWKQMGSPSRFLRDAIFWMGRGIQTYFDQAGNLSWSHLGADQTTFASNERLQAVAGLLTAYGDLVPRLEPLREVGIYVPPVGDPWGHATTRGSTVATLAALMTGYQVHLVSHGDLATPQGLARYPLIYAASIGPDSVYPFEQEAFKRYVAGGGKVVVSQAPNYYHAPETYGRYGISMREEQSRDEQGELRTNKDGTPRLEKVWTETPASWAKLTRETVWGWLAQGVEAAPIDVNLLYTHRDAAGKPATWPGSHWTGHHEWARYRGSALDQHAALAKTFASIREPLVRSDQPEVFVAVTKPRGGGAGWWVFASNWTIPDEPDLYTQRVPQGFFNSSVKPVTARLALKLEGAGAVYDVLNARRVATSSENGRLVFPATFGDVEGRIFAVLPEAVASAALSAPAQAVAGSPLRARFELRGAGGKPLGVLGAVRIDLLDASGTVLTTAYRALPADGVLPSQPLPAAGKTVVLRVTDLVAGFSASASIALQAPTAVAAPAPPVTVHRGDRVHEVLRAPGLVIAWDAGRMSFADETAKLAAANPQAARDRVWAEKLAEALRASGVAARVASSDSVISGALQAHPWQGEMARYRTRSTVPDVRIDAPLVLVGDPANSPLLGDIERAWVAGRSLGRDQVGPGRAVVSFQPRAFSPDADAVVVAAADDAGLQAAAVQLAAIAKAKPPADATYQAREAARHAWLPSEVALAKAARGLAPATVALPDVPLVETPAVAGWSGLAASLGQAVVAIDASPAGVVVGTKSWHAPTVLISADGKLRGAWGGGAEVTPRDVGISADGAVAWAGYSLMGRVAAYRAGGDRLLGLVTPVVCKDNPFEWDSFKDSDRHLAMSPDKQVAISPTAGGITAYEPATGKELWRVPGQVSPEAPRGTPMPEVAFSPEGRFALIAPTVIDGERQVRFTVRRQVWDPAAKRYDRKKQEEVVVTVAARLLRNELRLVEARTGKPVWTRTTGIRLVAAADGSFLWSPGRAPEQTVVDPATDKRPHTWKGADDAVPFDVGTGKDLVLPEITDLGMWHLYSAVGPEGRWSAAGTRDALFVVFDERGTPLRRFEPRQLPSELDPGAMIPPVLLPSRDPARILLYAPQARTAFVSTLVVGSAEQRRTAEELSTGNRALMASIRTVIDDRKQHGRFADQAWLATFDREIAAVPAELREALTKQMARLPNEAKAGRKRGPEWFAPIIERIENRLWADDARALDAAVALTVTRRLEMPAMISDLRSDADLATVYAGLWDGTVRAIATADGRERWRATVPGGSRLATVTDTTGKVVALYAGCSRGAVARIDPATGAVLWTVQTGERP